ncbi:hypothetical protein K435DRAFT_592573, partial [Dendrothele bispora CBS 962.96]
NLLDDNRKQIETHTVQIASLYSQQQSMQTKLCLLDSLLAPIRKLPLDVLRYLFQTIVFSQRSSDRGGIFDAIVLSHVCCSWREIALAIPSLWTDIYLSHFWYSEDFDIATDMMLQSFIARSRQYSLQITIVGDYEPV